LSSPEIIVLDVGHGNCAIVRDDGHSVLIDAPPKWATIRRTLQQFGITTLDAVFVSHQDRDHLSGAVPLLLDRDFTIGEIYVNPDTSKKGTGTERRRVQAAATTAVSEGRAKPPEALSTKLAAVQFGVLQIEVLAPAWEVTSWTAAGGTDGSGTALTGHTLSGVVRVGANTGRTVLLAGDLDSAGLDDLIAREVALGADWLVFPHHGGHVSDGDDAVFAARLCRMVKPEAVIFSHSRTRYHNPLPAVVAAVRAEVGDVRVACTQLSRNCAATVPLIDPTHLVDLPAAGRVNRCCCAGTLRFSLDADDPVDYPTVEAHRAFINGNAESALCR
jgi:competence protein ComEC